jgi:hypothetical protein
MKQVPHQRPAYVYVGRLPCGCAVALVNDEGNKHTAKSVAEFIKEGLGVNRESWQKYVDEISKEPTFMKCPHEGEEEQSQLPLFAAG